MPDVAFRVHVSGLVQGVFFRMSTQERATDLGLTGWVRNMIGGRLEVFVQGPQDMVDVLVTWLHDGPTAARVDEVHVVPATPEPRFTTFEIR